MKRQQDASSRRPDPTNDRTSSTTPVPDGRHSPVEPPATRGSHHGHRWMMLACCVPMVAIVAVLLATGAAGTSAVVFAAACVGIMTVMMLAMPRDH